MGDRDRGYLLELLLTKLRYAAGGGESVSPGTSQKEHTSTSASWNNGLQIVGMSATMPNVSDVATWLQVACQTPYSSLDNCSDCKAPTDNPDENY